MVFFIERGDASYQTSGRRENPDEANAIDVAYKKLMDELNIPYISVLNDDSVDLIIDKLKETGYIEKGLNY